MTRTQPAASPASASRLAFGGGPEYEIHHQQLLCRESRRHVLCFDPDQQTRSYAAGRGEGRGDRRARRIISALAPHQDQIWHTWQPPKSKTPRSWRILELAGP
eukprot:gene16411-biopygen6763